MAAATKNLTLEQGATFSKTLLYKTSAGVAIDLTGCTARSQLRETVDAATSVAFTVTVSPAASGQINWSMSAATTAALTATSYVYDLELEFPSGEVRRLLQGDVTVSPEVTR